MDWRSWKFVVARPVRELCQSDVNLNVGRRRQTTVGRPVLGNSQFSEYPGSVPARRGRYIARDDAILSTSGAACTRIVVVLPAVVFLCRRSQSAGGWINDQAAGKCIERKDREVKDVGSIGSIPHSDANGYRAVRVRA